MRFVVWVISRKDVDFYQIKVYPQSLYRKFVLSTHDNEVKNHEEIGGCHTVAIVRENL